MLRIPRRYSHFVYGIIQSGLTTGAATAIASAPFFNTAFLSHWLESWLLAWLAMLPVVLFAAPFIQKNDGCSDLSGRASSLVFKT
ncbi:MAG TPA: DUF2798 domain-containing protein [Xanthobacteraceae bacterium]|nr:DUF2798 domain-containing protein [Xanthobacteraceae bacterium]